MAMGQPEPHAEGEGQLTHLGAAQPLLLSTYSPAPLKYSLLLKGTYSGMVNEAD